MDNRNAEYPPGGVQPLGAQPEVPNPANIRRNRRTRKIKKTKFKIRDYLHHIKWGDNKNIRWSQSQSLAMIIKIIKIANLSTFNSSNCTFYL